MVIEPIVAAEPAVWAVVLDAESGTHRLVGLPPVNSSELRWALRVPERPGGSLPKTPARSTTAPRSSC
jgi:hypothetical protein